MKQGIAGLMLAATFAAPVAFANMRGPVYKAEGSSSALYAAKAGVKVLKEDLSFDCSRKVCTVQVSYWLDASAAVSTDLSFVMPNAVEVKASVNQQPVQASTKPLQVSRTQEKRLQREFPNHADSLRTLYQANFPAEFTQGENRVDVTYDQPLYEFEADYGYFKASRFLSVLRYEVWPLKEWTLSEGFSLNVQAKFQPEKKLNFLEKTLGTIQLIRCFDDRQDPPLPTDQRKDPYAQQASFTGAKLPNRLVCLIGDDDLVGQQRLQENGLFFFYNKH